MTRKADAEQTAMRNQRRQEQLATQDRLLQSVEMLDRDATARVLQSAPANIIMLVHSRTATVYIPSFQFNEDGTRSSWSTRPATPAARSTTAAGST